MYFYVCLQLDFRNGPTSFCKRAYCAYENHTTSPHAPSTLSPLWCAVTCAFSFPLSQSIISPSPSLPFGLAQFSFDVSPSQFCILSSSFLSSSFFSLSPTLLTIPSSNPLFSPFLSPSFSPVLSPSVTPFLSLPLFSQFLSPSFSLFLSPPFLSHPLTLFYLPYSLSPSFSLQSSPPLFSPFYLTLFSPHPLFSLFLSPSVSSSPPFPLSSIILYGTPSPQSMQVSYKCKKTTTGIFKKKTKETIAGSFQRYNTHDIHTYKEEH